MTTTRASAKAQQASPPTETVRSFKGFDENLRCRGKQYAVGQEVEQDGPVEVCLSGFHACEYPLDALRYYSPGSSRYAEVEQSGTLVRHDEDSKVASSRLRVTAEIGIAGLIKAAIDYTMLRVTPAKGAQNEADSGAASNSGDRGAASNSGYSGAASNSGDRGAASNSGDSGAASNSGTHGLAADFSGTGKARSGETGAIFLVRRNEDGSIAHVFASKVGENGIKPDAWYGLDKSGQPKEILQ